MSVHPHGEIALGEGCDLAVGQHHVDHDQSVDPPMERIGVVEEATIGPSGTDAQHDRVVPGFGADRLDSRDDLGEVPAVEEWHGHGDRPRAPGGES